MLMKSSSSLLALLRMLPTAKHLAEDDGPDVVELARHTQLCEHAVDLVRLGVLVLNKYHTVPCVEIEGGAKHSTEQCQAATHQFAAGLTFMKDSETCANEWPESDGLAE